AAARMGGLAVNIRALAGSNVGASMTPANESLMDRCVAGQRDAWRQLHDRYYRLAYVFLMRIGLRGSDAEDACQEVFVQVFRYLARFEGRADFKTWLYKLCVSQAGRV